MTSRFSKARYSSRENQTITAISSSRYRLVQIYFVCNITFDGHLIPAESRLGLHFKCYPDSRERYWLLNCVANDLRCSPPSQSAGDAMQTLDDVVDFFVIEGNLSNEFLEGVHYESPMPRAS